MTHTLQLIIIIQYTVTHSIANYHHSVHCDTHSIANYLHSVHCDIHSIANYHHSVHCDTHSIANYHHSVHCDTHSIANYHHSVHCDTQSIANYLHSGHLHIYSCYQNINSSDILTLLTNNNPTPLKIQVLWVVMLHHWASNSWRFNRSQQLHHEGSRLRCYSPLKWESYLYSDKASHPRWLESYV